MSAWGKPVLRWFWSLLAVAGLAVLWTTFLADEKISLRKVFGVDMAALLDKPYFHIGTLAVTPAFLIKSGIFFLLLAFGARYMGRTVRRQVLERTELDEGQKYAIERGMQYLIFLVGFMVGAESVGLSLSSLTVLGGALGIGIGFGLQQTANNFIAGLILLFERPIKVGDRVQLGDLNGQVIRIGSRSTWVRTNDNIVIILPNSEFITKPVVNWTANDPQVRFAVPVGVSYNSDPGQVRSILLETARRNPDVLDQPEPDVIFTGFGDSALEFELRVWTATKTHTKALLQSSLYFAIFEAFGQSGIEIPYPQRDLHFRTAEPVSQIPPKQ